MKNLLLVILTLGLIITISSCKKSSSDPAPVINNGGNGNNNGGNNETYFTSLDQTFTCDDLYEHVTFKGHAWSETGYDGSGCVQSTECETYSQYFSGQGNLTYSIGAIKTYNNAEPLNETIINKAIRTKGSFKVGQYQDFATTAYGVYSSTNIDYGFELNVYGYDPVNNETHRVTCIGIDEPGVFYAEITKVQRVYPKELTDNNLYIIEGHKNILIRNYDGVQIEPTDDTLKTTFKTLMYLAE